MNSRKILSYLVLVSMLFSLMLTSGVSPASAQNAPSPQPAGDRSVQAGPISPTDETKVPHYFGPYPNWAQTAFTLADATVTITGDGVGAEAAASVGANGAVTGITVTNPGNGYTTATVGITGGGTLAAADAVLSTSFAVTGINVTAGGAGYTSPVVTLTGGTLGVQATATAYGGIDTLALVLPGAGYTNPTVDFDFPDDPNGVQARAHAVWDPATGVITALVIDNPGAGYSSAPKVVIRDGTIFDPINKRQADAGRAARSAIQASELGGSAPDLAAAVAAAGAGATATATINIQRIGLDTFGDGYTSAPDVTITDATGAGAGATATAQTAWGAVTAINVTNPGSGYLTTGGIKKFQDGLPQLCIPGVGQTFADCTNNNLGQHIPIAVPDTTTYPGADYYQIAVVQTRERMSSSLPPSGTLLREYVQLETITNTAVSKHVALQTELKAGGQTPTLMPDGVTPAIAVDDPHFLGPVIVATKDRAVRIDFYNLLPAGTEGDLFLPVDSSMMGSGMGPMDMMAPMDMGTVMDGVRNPMCTEYPKDPGCFKDNRATLHLHGGISPWISDGTPHQWITPAPDTTQWPQGVSVQSVPDMTTCAGEDDGCMSFYYTNQQSARLMFYHDHSWGITRLNVYAGEAAGYVITDETEQKLLGAGGAMEGLGTGIPLVIQDRTFVPGAAQLADQDPTWDSARWGGEGNLWYHHVYMPAQNPGDPSGMSGYGRWMYGPWFWPPAKEAVYGPIANPYFDPTCALDNPATWQYQTDPFCEPALIPGTPNISVGMEQFNDTPIVNGTAYPTTTLEPKTYRLRILNAANDRFWNLQWYIADPTTGTNSEVALNPAEVAAAQTDPVVFPTALKSILNPATGLVESLEGPDWIQIGTEGGFLPAPVVVDGQQVTTWITDPTRFDVGNVDLHSLLLAPAERADVIVDFSKFAGKTLILYNDAPAAFPARVPQYDYYTGAPDMTPAGASPILPGYGPNTRTIMQVKIEGTAAAPFNLTALQNAFKHHADGSGVFESGQHPIIVGQAAYNSAYGTSFAAGSECNSPASTTTICDGLARIQDQGGEQWGFNTLVAPTSKLAIPLQPKAIHDEMNAASFDEFGRMTANLGLEAVPATPGLQNITLYPYVNPSTELIDATNLPRADVKVTPIKVADDGTQIWKFTHNGVDTHPIHFHLFDVQVLNRVAWDNNIIMTDLTELGWKDTVRMAPLEDTIVALRPIIPVMPFEVPNSVRNLNPMMPTGSTAMFNNMNANGVPTTPIVNKLVNFGWEYVYHCHILSHEEMDMMRPVSVAVPPTAPDTLAFTTNGNRLTLTWTDQSRTETGFLIQRMDVPGVWTDLGTVDSPLAALNDSGTQRSYVDTTYRSGKGYQYRVVALNTIGYGGEFMSLSAKAPSLSINVGAAPAAPTGLAATLQAGALSLANPGPRIRLTWSNPLASSANINVIERCTGLACTNFAAVATVAANATSFVDTTAAPGATYNYSLRAANGVGYSAYSNTVEQLVPALPIAPTLLPNPVVTAGNGNNRVVALSWTLNGGTPAATTFTVQRATTMPSATTVWATVATVPATMTSHLDTGAKAGTTYWYRIVANYTDVVRISNPSNTIGPVNVQ